MTGSKKRILNAGSLLSNPKMQNRQGEPAKAGSLRKDLRQTTPLPVGLDPISFWIADYRGGADTAQTDPPLSNLDPVRIPDRRGQVRAKH